MLQKYQATALISGDNFNGIKPGQWVRNMQGQRGQFLGVTTGGIVVVRWQPASSLFGAKRDTRNNAALRQYAKDYGSK